MNACIKWDSDVTFDGRVEVSDEGVQVIVYQYTSAVLADAGKITELHQALGDWLRIHNTETGQVVP